MLKKISKFSLLGLVPFGLYEYSKPTEKIGYESARESIESFSIMLVGRTGSGKSYLGNKFRFETAFKEGFSLISQTRHSEKRTKDWDYHPKMKITIVDTPGMGDNREEVSNVEIVEEILNASSLLNNDLTLGIFCLPGFKARFDADDFADLGLLKAVYKNEIFKYLVIAITHCDKMIPIEKEKAKRRFNELPQILSNHLIEIPKNKIYFTDDFADFEKNIYDIITEQSDSFKTVLPAGVHLENKDSIKKFVTSVYHPELAEIFGKRCEQLEKEYNQKIKDLEGSLNNIEAGITNSENSFLEFKKNREEIEKAKGQSISRLNELKVKYQNIKQEGVYWNMIVNASKMSLCLTKGICLS